MVNSLRIRWVTLAGLLLLARPGAAQVQFGDFSTNLSGNISAGYAADYGNQIGSSHGLEFGGMATYSGSYYDPNFLTFSVTPYYNQSRANSEYASISNASGVNAATSLFSGSYFPGSINYASALNSEGNIGIPGIANYTTHGDSNTFGVNWNEILPGKPSLSASFQMGSNSYSIYGTNDEGSSSSRSFMLHSGYTLDGFNLGAYFSTGVGSSSIPEIVSGQPETETHTDTTNFGVNVGHLLPMHGNFTAAFNRSDVNSDYLGYSFNGTIDTLNATAGVQPTNKLQLSLSANYSDNLTGQLYQPIITAGALLPEDNPSESSHSVDLIGAAGYNLLPNMQTTLFAEYRQQSYLGQSYSSDSFGGSATYGRGLWGGNVNAAGSIVGNTISGSSGDTIGFSASVNYSKIINGWKMAVAGNYAQNVQTLLIGYTSSNYGYSANVAHRWGRLSASAGISGGETALVPENGLKNTSKSYNASMGYGRWLTLNGSYFEATGSVIATGSGLIPEPVPPPILPPGLLTMFGGRGYSVGLSSSPVKRLLIGAGFSNSDSSTNSDAISSTNHNEQFNALLQYQFRKVYVTAGFSRLIQGFSASGEPPEMVSSYYAGITRWFNFF